MHPALGVLLAAAGFGLYTYVGYPLLLAALARARRRRDEPPRVIAERFDWPMVTVTIPVHNGAWAIGATLERVLASDYPRDRLQVLVVSDASTDGTDEVVQRYADQGVELLRLSSRAGKTLAENRARRLIRGDIVVNTDASSRLDPGAIKALVEAMDDPAVGVASGRDVSVSRSQSAERNQGESAYVGYEMSIRDLETRIAGIVGASGCLYAVRARLHVGTVLPDRITRDFAVALLARRKGYRTVSVPGAICYVSRVPSLRAEYRRKVRTVARGLLTLEYGRSLLHPRHGLFAWQLWSHKVCRWLTPWVAVIALIALGVLAFSEVWARVAVFGAVGLLGLAGLGWAWPRQRRAPRPLALAAFLVAGNLAVLHAWLEFLTGGIPGIWEPTRREAARQI